MNLQEAAKKLELDAEETKIRARSLGLRTENLTQEDLDRIKNYAPMAVSNRQVEPQKPNTPKPTAKGGTLKERFDETENATQAATAGKLHLNEQLFDQRYHDGRAVGQLSSMAYVQGVSEGSLEMDHKLLSEMISEEQGQIAELAASKFGLGKPIQQIYMEASEVKSLAIDLSIS